MENVDRDVVQLDHFGKRELGGPRRGVHVAADSADWRDDFELVKDCGVANIAGMNNEV